MIPHGLEVDSVKSQAFVIIGKSTFTPETVTLTFCSLTFVRPRNVPTLMGKKMLLDKKFFTFYVT